MIPAAADVCPHPAGAWRWDQRVTSQLVAGAAQAACTRGQPGQFEPNEDAQSAVDHCARPAGRRACCLTTGKRIASLSVHKHVEDLCAMVPDLCVCSGNAGDSAAWPQSEQGIYLGEHQSRPVDTEKIGIIHMPRSKNDE